MIDIRLAENAAQFAALVAQDTERRRWVKIVRDRFGKDAAVNTVLSSLLVEAGE